MGTRRAERRRHAPAPGEKVVRNLHAGDQVVVPFVRNFALALLMVGSESVRKPFRGRGGAKVQPLQVAARHADRFANMGFAKPFLAGQLYPFATRDEILRERRRRRQWRHFG